MAVAVNASRFEGITMAPPDPILGVSEAFKADTIEKKLNLGVGAYRTEELEPYVLNVVKKAAPKGSFILLHGCAHNLTDIDPTPDQWKRIADIIQGKNHVPFFDIAYQGFASGSLDEDAESVRLFTACGMELLVAQSYSKNLGLYAERIGAINIICSSEDAATRVKSQLKRLARPMYSNPPMEMMAGRIKGVRQKLFDSLSAKDESGKNRSFILKQIGVFSFTGLNKAQNFIAQVLYG
uniref:Aspartate aminotransferase n=1 Tax=Manihot esculenta TaxID=3983 RepID=A0A2C9W3J4_MANES